MKFFEFNSKRSKKYLLMLAIVLSPLILYAVIDEESPLAVLLLLVMIPMLFLINIPAQLFTALGVREYKFEEFGALPKTLPDWSMIILFWVVVVIVMSLIRIQETPKK